MNNHIEASHRHLQNELTMVHPTIWKFINGLRKFDKWWGVMHPRQKKKKYQDADKRIVTIVNQFMGNNPNAHPHSMWEFLRGKSHNYQINT